MLQIWQEGFTQSGGLRLEKSGSKIAEPATWRTFAGYRLKMDIKFDTLSPRQSFS